MVHVWIIRDKTKSIIDVCTSARKALDYVLDDYLDGYNATVEKNNGDFEIDYDHTDEDGTVLEGWITVEKWQVS
jgi:hypothetical protein